MNEPMLAVTALDLDPMPLRLKFQDGEKRRDLRTERLLLAFGTSKML